MNKQAKTIFCGLSIISTMLTAYSGQVQMVADMAGYYQHTLPSITVLTLAGATALLTLTNLVRLNLNH